MGKVNINTYIPIVALIIAIGSLCFTFWVQYKQNIKWNELNLGKISMKKVGFVGFKKYALNEVNKIDWGYSPDFKAETIDDGFLFTDDVRLNNVLVFVDKKNKKRIDTVNSFLTLKTGEEILKKLNFNSLPDNWEICKMYTLKFLFKNIGNTSVKINNVTIDLKKNNESNFKSFYKRTVNLTVLVNEEFNITKELYLPLNSILKDEIFLLIKIYYDTNIKQKNMKKYNIVYNPDDKGWYFE